MPGTLTKITNGKIVLEDFETDTGWVKESNHANSIAERTQNTSYGLPKDGTWFAPTRPPMNPTAGIYVDFQKIINFGNAAVKRLGVWHGTAYIGTLARFNCRIIAGGSQILDHLFSSHAGGSNFHSGWLSVDSLNGNALVELRCYVNADDIPGGSYNWWDRLVLMAGTGVKVTQLVTGQKIEVYTSGGTLVGSDTVGGGGDTDAEVAVTGQDVPFQGYLKIYAADGVTLLFTSSTQELWGGDVFAWSSDASYIVGPASSLRIYRQGAVATPKTVAITVTLKKAADDALISGKTINFTTSLGSVSPTSTITDVNGQASTTLTSGSSHGWAVVKASFAGDSAYGASKTFVEVAVYDEADAGNSSKPYQVFVQGTEYSHTSGGYKKSVAFQPQQFQVELPQIQSTIDGALEVIIYRRGTKDFVGRILKISKTIDNKMVLSGLSNHWKLARRLAKKSYSTEPKTIIQDLLSRYPAGISEGTLGTYGNMIVIAFDYDPLIVAIQRLLDVIGWKARLNLNDTLDTSPDFGATQSVSFITGSENVQLSRETDYTPVDTRTFLLGDPATVVSDKDDEVAAGTYGLVEEVFLDKNLTAFATVDIQNQKILDSRKAPVERISGTVIDAGYAASAFDVFDYVTVTDSATGLSGTYRVVSIQRDLRDKGTAEVEFSNESPQFQDALSTVSRTVKDLST